MTDNRSDGSYYAADAAFSLAAQMYNSTKESEYKALAREIAEELREDGHAEKEYITIPEACEATGWAEATLQKRLRGKVPMVGKGSYSRSEFFEYLKQFWKEKQDDADDNFIERAAQKAKVLAMSAARR